MSGPNQAAVSRPRPASFDSSASGPWDADDRSGRRAARAERDSGQRRAGTSPTSRRFSLTGLGAVVLIFLVTLGVATLESLIGVGLRTLTLIALAAMTLVAGLLVRRRDVLSVVVAPPLVFGLVAALEIMLAPTLNFTPTVVAAVLIRGFPTMTIATAIGLLVLGYRMIRRR